MPSLTCLGTSGSLAIAAAILTQRSLRKIKRGIQVCPKCGELGYGVWPKRFYSRKGGKPRSYYYFRHLNDGETVWHYLGKDPKYNPRRSRLRGARLITTVVLVILSIWFFLRAIRA